MKGRVRVMKTKGQKGFSIVNIIVGVILTLSSFIMFADETTYPGPLIVLPLGLVILICGWLTLRKLTAARHSNTSVEKNMLVFNLVCFVLSCIILAAVIILPIIGPML